MRPSTCQFTQALGMMPPTLPRHDDICCYILTFACPLHDTHTHRLFALPYLPHCSTTFCLFTYLHRRPDLEEGAGWCATCLPTLPACSEPFACSASWLPVVTHAFMCEHYSLSHLPSALLLLLCLGGDGDIQHQAGPPGGTGSP